MRERVKNLLGIGNISAEFFSLVQVHIFYMLFTNLHTLFVNTLFVKLTGDTNAVMKYNIIMCLLRPVIMVGAIYVMRHFSGKLSMCIGLADYLVLYVVFFSVMKNLASYIYLVSLLAAIGQAFFLMTYLTSVSLFSGEENINQTLAFSSLVSGIGNMFFSYFSGWLISRYQGLSGYYAVFAFSAVMAFMAFYKAIKLPKLDFGESKTQFGRMFGIAVHDTTWKLFVASEVLKGARQGVYSFYLNVMIYQIIQSEYLVGINNVLVYIAAIAGSWVVARAMRNNNRFHLVYLSITLLMIGNLVLMVEQAVLVIIVFAAMDSFFRVFLDTGFSSMFYTAVQKTPGGKGLETEFVFLSQCCMGSGSAIGTFLVFFLSGGSSIVGAAAALTVLTASQYLCAFLVKKMQDRLQPGQEVFFKKRRV